MTGARGDGTTIVNGGDFTSVNRLIVGGSFENQVLTALFRQTGGTVSTQDLDVGQGNSTATYSLEAGSLSANAINIGAGDTFNWGNATISTYDSQANGTIDYSTGPAGTVVRSGTTLVVDGATGNLTTGYLGGNSTLDLGGLFNNSGVRFNQMTLTGTLDLSAGGDTLISIDNPYALRAGGLTQIEYGSLVLVDAAGGITSVFDTFVAPLPDAIGFSEYTGTFTTAAALPIDTWFLEYTNDGGAEQIIFHYRVSGAVPEPGTVGFLALGLMFIRGMRTRKRRRS